MVSTNMFCSWGRDGGIFACNSGTFFSFRFFSSGTDTVGPGKSCLFSFYFVVVCLVNHLFRRCVIFCENGSFLPAL